MPPRVSPHPKAMEDLAKEEDGLLLLLFVSSTDFR
jgi:hypothetical protein